MVVIGDDETITKKEFEVDTMPPAIIGVEQAKYNTEREIKFENPVKVSNNVYTIDVKIENMDLNYINGRLILPNGRINSITMASGWKNKNNTSNNFYFYRNGIVKLLLSKLVLQKVEITLLIT